MMGKRLHNSNKLDFIVVVLEVAPYEMLSATHCTCANHELSRTKYVQKRVYCLRKMRKDPLLKSFKPSHRQLIPSSLPPVQFLENEA
jgi:hypothetical protein